MHEQNIHSNQSGNNHDKQEDISLRPSWVGHFGHQWKLQLYAQLQLHLHQQHQAQYPRKLSIPLEKRRTRKKKSVGL